MSRELSRLMKSMKKGIREDMPMFFKRFRDKRSGTRKTAPGKFLGNKQVKRALLGAATLLVSFLIVQNGAAPERYDIKLGEISQYDITAPRDVENVILTIKRAEDTAEAEPPVLKRDNSVPIFVVSQLDDLFSAVEKAREIYTNGKTGTVEETGEDTRANSQSNNQSNNQPNNQANSQVNNQGNNKSDSQESNQENRENNQEKNGTFENAVRLVVETSTKMGIPMTYDLAGYLVSEPDASTYNEFRTGIRNIIGDAMAGDITKENLAQKVAELESRLNALYISDELKDSAAVIVRTLIRPNSTIDEEATRDRRLEVYNNMLAQKVMIKKGARILSIGDTVTEDKLQVLEELNLLDSDEFDYVFSAGILLFLSMLGALLVLYLKKFCTRVYDRLNELIVISIIIIIMLGAARVISGYSPLLIPVFIAPMLISILLDIRLAVILNLILTVAVSLFTEGNFTFITMAIISGSMTPFIVSRANQRSTLSATGLLVALINVLVIGFMGMIGKSDLRSIASDSILAAVNGVVSIVITIGLLPFMESAFNIITPLKLLELANPNQPLIKRLLMEAPGTYHHSLMVGNLAEVAAEAIGGNALLARVGAYYHDIGKVKRPNFFGENQLAENPHDRMSPNLSTLVITSHTDDGVEMAKKYKIPSAIRDIIGQHHGTTLVAYFYHKAKKENRENTIKEEDFRYHGPRPGSREAAVVMLADSVEAAVRSMPDKTVGKIEGLVRKIIKDKLDDGQLDQCDITLKDLDEIAKAFMQVFSGFFHARERYPEIKPDRKVTEVITSMEQVEYLSGNRD